MSEAWEVLNLEYLKLCYQNSVATMDHSHLKLKQLSYKIVKNINLLQITLLPIIPFFHIFKPLKCGSKIIWS